MPCHDDPSGTDRLGLLQSRLPEPALWVVWMPNHSSSRDTSWQLRMLRRRRGARSRGGRRRARSSAPPSARSSGGWSCPPPALARPTVTPALFAAGAYLRENADPRDVIATNRVINGTTRDEGEHNRDLSVSALGGLRTDVSGFG